MSLDFLQDKWISCLRLGSFFRKFHELISCFDGMISSRWPENLSVTITLSWSFWQEFVLIFLSSYLLIQSCWFFGLFTACHYDRAVVWTPFDQNLRFGKSFIGVLLRSWPHGPQECPMGPKFLAQKFSHIILKWCYFMHFGDLLCKKCSKSWKTVYF